MRRFFLFTVTVAPADVITVADELKKRGELTRVGGASHIHTLIVSVPTAANAQYYAEIVKGARDYARRPIEAGTKIAQLGYANETEVDTLVRIRRRLRFMR